MNRARMIWRYKCMRKNNIMSKESDQEICNLLVKEFFDLNRGATQQEMTALQFGAKAALIISAKQLAERDARIKASLIEHKNLMSLDAFDAINEILEGNNGQH